MPVRIGLMLNGLVLTENATDNESTFGSIGPYFEVAPEFTIAGRRNVQWSLYSELGVGVGGTAIEFDGDSNDYNSATAFFGLELAGTRLRLANFEHWGSPTSAVGSLMDQSDEENGQVALGYDAQFQGLTPSLGVVF